MRQFDDKEHAKTRNPERPGDAAGLALPARVRGTLFQGWGPKLMLAALAVSALCAPAMAQQASYISATGISQAAPDRETAIQSAVNCAEAALQAECSGTVENEVMVYDFAAPYAFRLWSARVILRALCVQ
jgi:hypothetical protein